MCRRRLRGVPAVNLKSDFPDVTTARKRLIKCIDSALKRDVPLLKIVHGYGSKGCGGTLRVVLRESLLQRRREGKIARFVYGERWHVFDPLARSVLQDHPEYRRDSDFNRFNRGVTIIELLR